MLARLGAEPVAVRSPAQLDGVEALVLPGGESTTMSMLLESSGLFDAIAGRLADGMPAFGTCAGMILLGREILDGRPDQRSFGALGIAVQRNAFGRQVDSFEADLAVEEVDGPSVHAVFIRRRWSSGSTTASRCWPPCPAAPCWCEGHVMAAAFHPELGDDARLHQLFIDQVV